MRIIYLHQYFNTPEDRGGTRSYEMARRLVEWGHEVHMVTSDRREGSRFSGWRQRTVEGIQVYERAIRYSNSSSYRQRIRAFVSFAVASARLAAAIPADVVIATSTPLTIAFPALYARWRQRIPMVFEVRDLWPEMPVAVGALRNPILIAAARWLERVAYRGSTEIVALSPGIATGISAAGTPVRPVTVIPNAADLDVFQVPPSIGESFRERNGWLAGRPLVLYAGAFARLNGVGFLARLAHQVRMIDPDVRFLAVGEGSEKSKLLAEAGALGVLGSNFFVWDGVPKKAMPELLSAATIATSLFLDIPNMWKNSANKFFDALAAGRPVAINYGGWMADMLSETGAGLVLDPHDVPRSAALLRQRLRDETWLASARRSASELATTRFDRDKLARQLEEVLLRTTGCEKRTEAPDEEIAAGPKLG